MSAIAGKFYQDPALLSSFRGWVHAQAFSYLHPMGALQPHKGEEPVTVQAQPTSPCRGASYHRVEVRATWPRKAASKHQRDSSQTQGKATAPRRPSSARRLHSHRDHNPDTNRRPLRAVLCPLQPGRWANDLPSPATGRRRGNKILPGFPFAPSPLPSWRPPPRSCPSSYGPFPSCRVLNWLGGSCVRAPAARPACSALRCFSRGAGKGGRKGKSGRRSTQAEEAAGWCAGGRGSMGRPVLLLPLPLLPPLPYWVLTVQAAAMVTWPLPRGRHYCTQPAARTCARAPPPPARAFRANEPAIGCVSSLPRPSALRLFFGACAGGRSDADVRRPSCAHAYSENLPAEAELDPSRKAYWADSDRMLGSVVGLELWKSLAFPSKGDPPSCHFQ